MPAISAAPTQNMGKTKKTHTTTTDEPPTSSSVGAHAHIMRHFAKEDRWHRHSFSHYCYIKYESRHEMRLRSLLLQARTSGLCAGYSLVLPSAAHQLSLRSRPQMVCPVIIVREFSGSDVEAGEKGSVATAPLQPSWSWVPPREADSPLAEESSIPVIKKFVCVLSL